MATKDDFRKLHQSGRIQLQIQQKRYLEQFKQPRKSNEYERFRYCLVTGTFTITDTPMKESSLNLIGKQRKFIVSVYDFDERSDNCRVELLFRVPVQNCIYMFCQFRPLCPEELRKVECPRIF